MTNLPIAQTHLSVDTWSTPASDTLALSYEDRFFRRKVLTCVSGARVLVDLPTTTSLDHGDALQTADGALIKVTAAAEPLLAITADDLTRIAWHVGNRHTPCQISPTRLLIQRDKVIVDMLQLLGATVTEVTEPFTPEGGAYGHGRTHSHDHGHSHSHSQESSHDHAHDDVHSHGHSHDH